MPRLTKEIGNILRQKGLSLGTVESATGGLISHLITGVSGSSDYYKGSVISYSNDIKINVLGVKKSTLEKYGAVSQETVEEMAVGGRQLLNVDICIADTGIAGPTGETPEKPIGLFYIGLSHSSMTFNQKYIFHGSRAQNKLNAARTALIMLKTFLKNI
jgi:PncC family amidohydrolase